jgi:phospholipid/cholesterol/gamma-HCH transport system substrate-binding protein
MRRRAITPFAAGLIALAVILVGTYFGFAKHVPFTHGFRVRAVFQSANSIRAGSPVRIAGVNVGKVTGVERFGDTDMSVVEMELERKGLPIRRDATAQIRPRIFLEGNFFVDLRPGTPSAPKLQDGDTLPVTQTSAPVQLDQVLTALQASTREDLQALLEGYGQGLDARPRTGLTGAQALNRSLRAWPSALRGTAIVNQALLGERPHDLSRLVAAQARIARALDSREEQLKDLVSNLNTTLGATAAESASLQAALRLLPPTLQTADRTFAALNAAFPPTRAFAREILPGLRETPATIDAAFPWIAQTRALLGPAELQGAARQLRATTPDLTRLVARAETLLPQLDLIDRCLYGVVLPTGDIKLDDGPLSTGKENYKEFWYALTGIAGEGQSFDGNGPYVRFQTGGGPYQVSLASKTSGQLFGNSVAVPLGNRPAYPGKRPPYRPDVPCTSNQLPNLNGPAAAKSAP